MRQKLAVGIACMLTLVACKPASSVGQRQRAERMRILDSLAAMHPCRPAGYRVLAPPTWSAPHACAIAARAVQLLAAAAPGEPHLAPGDTARIRAVSVFRIQTCEISLDSPAVPGRVTPVWYNIAIDVPQRPRWIAMAIDGSTLQADGGVGVVHKHFDGADTLDAVNSESADTLEIGGPCG